jgi:hypothetical protein
MHRAAFIVFVLVMGCTRANAAPSIKVLSNASGVLLGGTSTAATMNLGSSNGLGVGPASGVTAVMLGTGPVFTSPVSISVSGFSGAGTSVTVTAYVSSNFAHGGGASPSVMVMQCLAADCTSSASHTALSLNSGSPSTLRTGLSNATFNWNVGALILYLNGSSAFTGTESAVVTFRAVDVNDTTRSATATLTISTTVQQVVQLGLDTSAGLAVTAGTTTSYLIDFGTVDGLGVSTGAGASRTVEASGARYSSRYRIRPAFSSMSSTTATVRMYVSSNFAHTGLLQLQDSASGASGSFAAISTNSAPAQQTVISSAAASKADLTRYLGLFVFNINGSGAYTGADSAVITYTVVVP